MRIKLFSFLLLGMLLISLAPAMSQDIPYTLLTQGLDNPRGINFNENGVLYIAEAGVGGSADIMGPFGPAKLGFSGRISAWFEDERSVVIDYLPSMDMNGEVVGPMDVVANFDALWVVMGHEMEGVALSGTVVNFNRISTRPNMIFDVFGYEHRYDPDGTGELLSNPTSIALAPDGLSALLIDASGNALYRATITGTLEVVKAWENNPVPTSIAYNEDGSQYAVGFLSGFPFASGSARVEVYDSASNALLMTYEGLTNITDVLFDDGALLAVSYAEFDPAAGGWQENSGSVVAITPDGILPVVTGLNFPYSIAKHPIDLWYAVSINAVSGAGNGAIIFFAPGG